MPQVLLDDGLVDADDVLRRGWVGPSREGACGACCGLRTCPFQNLIMWRDWRVLMMSSVLKPVIRLRPPAKQVKQPMLPGTRRRT